MSSQLRHQITNFLPIIVDLGAILLYGLLMPTLVDRFVQKSALNAVIIGGMYALFCGSVYLLRKLGSTQEENRWGSTAGLAFLGVFFGIMVTYLMAETGGVFAGGGLLSASNLEGGHYPIIIIGGGLVWLLFIFAYAAVLMANIRPTIPEQDRRYTWLELLALLGINLMVIVTMAGWQAIFFDTEPYESLGLGAKCLIFFATYAFFLIFFAPPRLVLLVKNTRLAGYVTFLLQTGYYVWSFLSRTAW